MVELADSLDSGSSAHYGRAGSSPASRTKKYGTHSGTVFFYARGGKGLKPRFNPRHPKNASDSAAFLAGGVHAASAASRSPATSANEVQRD